MTLDLPSDLIARGAASKDDFPGCNVFLLGGSGSGKTHSIRTLLTAGLEVFVLFTEPGMEVLADTDPDQLHWSYVRPASPSFPDMIDSAKKINTLDLKTLSNLGDLKKSKYTNFIDILVALDNFKCQRTGKEYGSVEDWGTNRAIVVDSLSGLSIAAMNLVVGSKPVKSQADWGVAMDNLERLILKLCVDTQAFFVLTAHLERETDEITGGSALMPSTLGRKLAPKLGRYFSDVVHVERKVDRFTWSTATANIDLKARNLPIRSDLPPSFAPIVKKWKDGQKS